MDEFTLIRRFFASSGIRRTDVVLGVGDDCALLRMPPGVDLAVTTDTLVAGRHFPPSTSAWDIGWKSLAVNLSDLAAMGARPRWFTLALTLPEADPDWLHGFSAGLQALAKEQNVALVGGDTTRGSLSITITAMGSVRPNQSMRRDAARCGDLICVTGTIGDAALALRLARNRRQLSGKAGQGLRQRLDRPQPRVRAGLALGRVGAAAIDVSDGLAADLGHLLDASGFGGEIQAAALPRSPEFDALAPDDATALRLQLHGGDDYELCVSLRPADVPRARRALMRLGVPLTVIGRVTTALGLRLHGCQGVERLMPVGFNHFTVCGP